VCINTPFSIRLHHIHYLLQWGEGVGGGWFRLERGANALAMESHSCSWAVPAAEDVQRVLQEFDASVAL